MNKVPKLRLPALKAGYIIFERAIGLHASFHAVALKRSCSDAQCRLPELIAVEAHTLVPPRTASFTFARNFVSSSMLEMPWPQA